MSSLAPFSVRSFLRQREALLVHFNTPMSTKHPTCFPADLRDAKENSHLELSFSTIQAGDLGPYQVANPGDANAGGSVGIIVDIKDIDSVTSVYWEDSGSSEYGSLGKPPDAMTCSISIDKRESSNEWRIKSFKPLGMFVFIPAFVFVKREGWQGDVEINLFEILKEFQADRIFTTSGGKFLEYDRRMETWAAVAYGDIVPA